MRHLVFGLSPDAASFKRLGFDCPDASVRGHLEDILRVFVAGYNAALQLDDHEGVSRQLESTYDRHHVGFAFEGAGMGYALFDLLAPWSRSRLRAFTDGAGRRHDYIATVGAGFAVARVPWGIAVLPRYLQNLDAAVAWCVWDGYGFHQGIFHHERFLDPRGGPPAAVPAYARPLFDSGLARSLWWAAGASPARIARAIDRFPEARRAEMWCGIGVAAAYAGGVDEGILPELLERSGAYAVDFLSGLPFAARMRQKGENPSAWTERACRQLLDMTADEAADLIVRHVAEVSAAWEGREQDMREQGYARLRHRLRRACERQGNEEPWPVGASHAGKAYGRQES